MNKTAFNAFLHIAYTVYSDYNFFQMLFYVSFYKWIFTIPNQAYYFAF